MLKQVQHDVQKGDTIQCGFLQKNTFILTSFNSAWNKVP